MSNQISAFLIDIDGTLISDNQRIPGAPETIEYLNENRIPYLLITNTTRKSRISVWHHLKRLGFSIEEQQILTAPLAAVQWLHKKGVKKIHLFLTGNVIKDFKDFKITTANPEYVIVGDPGQNLTYDNLNLTFRLIMDGAKILALQKNRHWHTAEGLAVDAGAVVAALEFATQKRATIMGKPRRGIFLQAAELLQFPPENIAIIGDDLESDVVGGKKAGLVGIAVKTGKFRDQQLSKIKQQPDMFFNSIAELPDYIKNREENFI